MSDVERPTLPPPRRRQERRDTPPSQPSDSRELVLRQLREVEERAKNTTQQAIAEVVDVFERQIAERDEHITELEETIRALQRADTAALRSHAELQASMSASIAASVTVEVKRQLNALAAAEGAEAGATAGKAAGSRAGARWTPIAGFLGAVIAAAVSYGAKSCEAGGNRKTPPATQQPASGPGYGGRW